MIQDFSAVLTHPDDMVLESICAMTCFSYFHNT